MRVSIGILFAGFFLLIGRTASAQTACPDGTIFQAGNCVVLAQPAQVGQPVQVSAQVEVGQPQPMYVQPVPMAQQGYMQPQPMRMRREGGRHRGLLIGGAVMFGVPYLISLLSATVLLSTGYSNDATMGYMLLIPLAGPFIDMALVRGSGAGVVDVFLALDGLLQVGGLVMLIFGARRTDPDYAAAPRTRGLDGEYAEVTRSHRPSWSVLPVAAGASAGMTFSLTHF